MNNDYFLSLNKEKIVMEKIVIEVNNKVAQAWRKLTPTKKRKLSKKASERIGNEVLKKSKTEYLGYLNDLRNKMAERGLTQEILDDILNERD